MVENPIIATYVDEVLKKIEIKAREEDLPIFVRKTVPKLEDSFWVNVIGKGYPVPNTAFRWCTEKLKIKPTARFIIVEKHLVFNSERDRNQAEKTQNRLPKQYKYRTLAHVQASHFAYT